MKDEIYKIEKEEVISLRKGESKHSVYQLFYDKTKDYLFFTSSKFYIKTPSKIFSSVIPVKQISKIDHKYYAYASSMGNGVFYIDKTLESQYDKDYLPLNEIEEDGIHFIHLLENEVGRGCQYDAKNNVIYFITNYGLRSYKENKLTEFNSNNLSFYHIQLLKNTLYCVTNEERVYFAKDDKIFPIELDPIMQTKNLHYIKSVNNQLALLGENAVYLYSPKTKKTKKLIDISNETECNDISFWNNNYYLATDEGIIQMKSDLEERPNRVSLFINNVYADDKKIDLLNLKFLKYTENNIDIQFSVLSINPNTQYKLYYRVNNNRWEEIENASRNVKFSSLASGSYALQLKVVYDSNEVFQTIYLTINVPFWSTWWFSILIFILFALLIYIIYRVQISRINKKNRLELEKINLEKNLNQSKLKSIKSQMNPHFFFNALNTLQSYILSNEKSKPSIIYLVFRSLHVHF